MSARTAAGGDTIVADKKKISFPAETLSPVGAFLAPTGKPCFANPPRRHAFP
jgi:hypothetical protein